MNIHCPNCRHTVNLPDGHKGQEFSCPTCEAKILLERIGSRSWFSQESHRKVGRFDLIEELGSGSFGFVFKAKDPDLARTVAIKIPRAGRLVSPEEIERFFREARSAAQLKHPGIVSIFETGKTEEGTPFLVSEFVPGVTLDRYLKSGRLSYKATAELVAKIARSLDYAHGQGVIHRDIKPANVMLDNQGEPHLMDFGLAKWDADEVAMSMQGQVLGTPAYMSPEQVRGEADEVDGRADVYSLGVTLYELLTGEWPFRGNLRMVMMQITNDEPRAPRQFNEHIPKDLETICLKAMAKDPDRRYQSAKQMADDLDRYLKGDAILARPMGLLGRTWRWSRRNPVPVGLLLAISLGSGVGIWQLSKLSSQLVQDTAIESVKAQVAMLEDVNSLYSGEILSRVHPKFVRATHDYKDHEGTVPIPATFLTELGEKITSKHSGVVVRHYSDYPFKFRKDGGARDDFEIEALIRLRQNPRNAFYRFEEVGGKYSLRFASARLLKASCVPCHNEHPDSPKRDWKEGDVRGILEIIHPLETDVQRTESGLQSTYLTMGIIGAGLLIMAGSAFFLQRARRS